MDTVKTIQVILNFLFVLILIAAGVTAPDSITSALYTIAFVLHVHAGWKDDREN